MTKARMLTATVSGSFHRHMIAIYEAVGELRCRGVDVLSPSDPRVVDSIGEFLFVASDRLRSIKLVQDRHLAAIKQSDFLWVVAPDGYTGSSTSGEVMFAYGADVPVFSNGPIMDLTFAQYIQHADSFNDAIKKVRSLRRRRGARSVLLDPVAVTEEAHSKIERMSPLLMGYNPHGTDPAQELSELKGWFDDTLNLGH